MRLRGAEGRIVDMLLDFTIKTWGKPLVDHAWEDFWIYDDVPDDLPSTSEFDTMFVPWLVLGFVPDPESDEARDDWPTPVRAATHVAAIRKTLGLAQRT